MSDVKELDVETTNLDALLRCDGVEPSFLQQAMLLEFVLHKSQRKRRAIHRHIQVRKNKRQGANVVLMTVREKDGFDFAFVFEKAADIGDDAGNLEQFLIWEH